jgi:hypothetical protein
MKITCQHCGQTIEVKGLGRKPKAMPVINICDTVKAKGSVRAAARELGCSRAYIYKVLQANGINPSDIERGAVAGQVSGENTPRTWV